MVAVKTPVLQTLGLHDVRGAAGFFGKHMGLGMRAVGVRRAGTGQPLVQKRQRDQGHCTRKAKPAKQGVEHKDHDQKKRRPRDIKKGVHRWRGQQPADGIQIAQPGGGWIVARRVHCGADLRREDTGFKRALKACAESRQNAPARIVQHPHQAIKCSHKQEQRQQCFRRSGGQNTVIDLQHEKRPREHQDIHEDTEKKGITDQGAAAIVGHSQLLKTGEGSVLDHIRLMPVPNRARAMGEGLPVGQQPLALSGKGIK